MMMGIPNQSSSSKSPFFDSRKVHHVICLSGKGYAFSSLLIKKNLCEAPNSGRHRRRPSKQPATLGFLAWHSAAAF